MRKKTKQTRKA